MTISEMLGQSGLLTLLGMSVVFSFLVIMILAMYLLHGILHALHLDKDKEADAQASSASPAPASAPADVSAVDNGAVVAAIAAAVKERQSL